jgi:hypothetical protein
MFVSVIISCEYNIYIVDESPAIVCLMLVQWDELVTKHNNIQSDLRGNVNILSSGTTGVWGTRWRSA